MKFNDNKLAQIFPETMGYFLEKIFEGCHGNTDRHTFAAIHVDGLIKVITEFRAALTERGILPAYSSLNEDIETIEYPLRELLKYFRADVAGTLNEQDGYIFAFFVKHQITSLRTVALEFDKEYEEDVPD